MAVHGFCRYLCCGKFADADDQEDIDKAVHDEANDCPQKEGARDQEDKPADRDHQGAILLGNYAENFKNSNLESSSIRTATQSQETSSRPKFSQTNSWKKEVQEKDEKTKGLERDDGRHAGKKRHRSDTGLAAFAADGDQLGHRSFS